MIEFIRNSLFDNKDDAYRDFHSRLVPNLHKETIIGVRTPILKQIAKDVIKKGYADSFVKELPHKSYEENNLHAFIIANENDFDKCIELVDAFLPYVDNWATCDGLRPKCFARNKDKLFSKALEWIYDEKVYTKRFGIQVIMNHFLEDSFDVKHFEIVSSIRSEEYYVNMMIAWYFATALAKQYDEAVKVLQNRQLDKWTHNKTIQKAVESYKISEDKKNYLKTLRV